MNEYELQVVLTAFRQEAQADRLALQNTISEGFEKLHGALTDHHGRIEVLEDRSETNRTVLWGLFLTLLGVLIPIGYHIYAGSK